MPSLFSRRYMRKLEEVGKTERVLAVFILLLLAVILVAYLKMAGSDQAELFSVDQSGLRESVADHGLLVARQMLPPLADPEWAAGEVEAFSASDLPVALGEQVADFEAFGVTHLYRRRYQTGRGPERVWTALICDVETPRQAFGLMRARQPSQAETTNTGRGGWRMPCQIGFWNGRYYTELSDDGTASGESAVLPDKAMTLSRAAAAIAAVQLSYGGPFPMAEMLPPEGRIPGSLRYVHRKALGIDALKELFLVDLAGGTTAWVMDAGTAPRAEAVVQALKSSSQGSGTSVSPVFLHSPEARATPLTVMPWGDGVMAVFAAGRHVHGAYGGSPAGITAVAMTAYDMAVAGSSVDGAPAFDTTGTGTGGEDPFPDPGLDDWRPPAKVAAFSPDNLYKKINGRADLYLQFQVARLTFGTYAHAADRQRTIDVYWYDMAKPDNAMGIYRAEAPEDATPAPVGRDGYATGGAVFFHKGSSYVQVLPAGPDAGDAAAALEIARQIGALIEDSGGASWALAVLPETGRVPDSIEYLAQDVFGLDFLKDVFTAEYDVDGGRMTMFIHRAGDEATAAAVLEQYRDYFNEYGKVLWTDSNPSRPIVAGEAAGVIDVVFVKGKYFGGVAAADDLEAAKKAAAAFFEGLSEP